MPPFDPPSLPAAGSASTAPAALARRDIRTLGLASLGGVLEFYDFVIFVFFAKVLGQLFFPADTDPWLRQLQTYGIFAAGYLARPLGGVVMAHFGDRAGRKRMFTLSVLLMALPTLAIGLLPTYATIGAAAPLALLLLRLCQGAAIGGEIPGAWVFVAEHVPARRTGFACAALTSGLTGGILLGSLVATWINRHHAPAEVLAGAWRIPFLLGGVFGLVAVQLRRWLEETPVFEELRRRRQLSAAVPLVAVLRAHRRGVVRSMALTWVLTAAIVVVILMTPTLLQTLNGISAADALYANSVASLALSAGCLLVGWLVDRVGTGPVLVVGSVCLAAATWALYALVPAHPGWLVPLYALAGACVAVIAAVPTELVRAFPSAVRFSGISLSYNLAYAVFGGLTPPLVTLLVQWNRTGAALYVVALAGLGLVCGLRFWQRDRTAALNPLERGVRPHLINPATE